ncbi:DUF3455 domain-containing protein [Streptomyces caeruleatus]|uniref:Uncharacterized protein n=1 Tax=Streptomyces caeruleatus TaxID=661399 RepID=A0A101TJQ3_9ACTN|nr:DUF3455 domain-containing protein [Streptomyces caeruleatus]KUN93574.1 hypothetical protein AQJ67_38190 [Streptomyces caeruleatus]
MTVVGFGFRDACRARANGDGNILELDLKATRSGRHHGLLAGTAEIRRLNTVGGVAPAGSCTPGVVVGVPYRADYVFLNG